jgi:hypothetical protein
MKDRNLLLADARYRNSLSADTTPFIIGNLFSQVNFSLANCVDPSWPIQPSILKILHPMHREKSLKINFALISFNAYFEYRLPDS